MLKKIKGLFIEDAPGTSSDVSSSSKPSPDANTSAPKTNSSAAMNGDVPEASSTNRFLTILAQTIEKNNQPGFDYFEYKQALTNLAKLNMDEMTRYQSAYAAAQSMGVTPVALLQSAQGYLSLMDSESQKFAAAEQNQRTKVMEEKRNEVVQLSSDIQKKQDMMKSMQAEIDALNKNLEDKKNDLASLNSKLDSTKLEFDSAMKSITGQITNDIQKMKQYLKQ